MIKFRAYDENKKKFVHFDDIKFGENGAYAIVYYDPKRGDVVQELAYIVLQQFTGCRDKSGKEIYAGDVLETQELNDIDPDNKFYETVHSVVTFEDGCFFAAEFQPLHSVHLHKWEIVGNIYENPELAV